MNDRKLNTRLGKLRARIDQADRDLFRALGSRFETVVKIGELKRAHGLTALQSARWKAVLRQRLAMARKNGLGERFVRHLLALIHAEALRVQKSRRKIRKKRKS